MSGCNIFQQYIHLYTCSYDSIYFSQHAKWLMLLDQTSNFQWQQQVCKSDQSIVTYYELRNNQKWSLKLKHILDETKGEMVSLIFNYQAQKESRYT